MDGNDGLDTPTTRRELIDLETRVTKRVAELVAAMEERLAKRIQDAQVETFSALEKPLKAAIIRIRQLEASLAECDRAASQRLDQLEERVADIEIKLLERDFFKPLRARRDDQKRN